MEIATTNKKNISNLIKLLGKVEGVIIQKKMSKHDLCRVCLSHNIRMYTLDKTRYQEIYEKQTGGTLITGDGRPDMVCYICNSQLQRFFKFLQMSEKTEKYLNKMCRNGVVLTQEKVFGIASAHCLSVKTLISMSVTGVEGKPFDSESIARTIDFEVPCIDKTIQDVAVKIESVDYEEIDLDVPEIDITTPVPEDTDSNETIEIVPAINNKEMILKQVSVALERLPITRSRLQKAEPTTKHFYSCKQCARRFRTVDNLNTHRKSIHRARRCECVKCDKTFAKPVDLRRHMLRVHSTRRPHVCPLCERRFKHRSMFYVHIRTHTGEKPFSCNWCDKTFNDKSNCRKHMKTHTDNPSRHACFLCDLTFNQRSRLLQHAVDHIL